MNKATLEQVQKILDIAETVSQEQVQRALDSGALMNALRGTETYITTPYRLMTDESSISDLLKAGNYDWSNDRITDQNFPATEHDTIGEKDAALFHFDRNISSEDAIAGMKTEGYRPATMRELLTFGKENPEVQRKFPIVALGQVVALVGGRHVGDLVRDGSGRHAGLFYFDGDWSVVCRFLAVRI